MIGNTMTEAERPKDRAIESVSRVSSESLRLSRATSPRRFFSRLHDTFSRPSIAGKQLAAVARPAAAVFDQAIVSGTSFVAAVLVGRWAGDAQLGLYSLGFTLVVLACGVQESLVLIPYTVLAARTADDRRRQFATSTLLQSALASVVMVAILGIGGVVVFWAGSTPLSGPLIAVLSVAVPTVLLREFGRRFAFAQIKLRQALILDSAVAAVQLSLLAWLAFSSRLSAVAGLGALAVACAAIGLAWLAVFRRQFALAPAALANDWQRNWSLGRWFLAGHVTGIIQAYTSLWLLAILLGTEATGEYAAAVTIVSLANPLIIGVGNLLMPVTAHAFAQSGAAAVWSLAVRSTRWLALVLAVFCSLAVLFGDWLLGFIYGASFSGQAATIVLLALATSIAALGVSAEHGLRALDRPRMVFVANLLALIVTLAVATWFVTRYGTVGAAVSLLAGNLVGCLVRWWTFRFSILDFGLSIDSSQSKIQNPKSKIGDHGGTRR